MKFFIFIFHYLSTAIAATIIINIKEVIVVVVVIVIIINPINQLLGAISERTFRSLFNFLKINLSFLHFNYYFNLKSVIQPGDNY